MFLFYSHSTGGSDPTSEEGGTKRRRLVNCCKNYRSHLINNNYDSHDHSEEITSSSTIANTRKGRDRLCHRSTNLALNSGWLNNSFLVFLVFAQVVTVFFGGVSAGIVGSNDFTSGVREDAPLDSSYRHQPLQQVDSSQLSVAPVDAIREWNF